MRNIHMKSKSLNATLLALALCMMGSACKENLPSEVRGGGNSDGSIAFYATCDPLTKLSGTTWEIGDKIGVYMQKTGSSLSSPYTYKVENKSYNITVSGVMSPSDLTNLYYAPNLDALDFYAYYPYAADQVSNGVFRLDLTQQRYASYRPLMWAKVTNRAAGAVSFGFKHQLARIRLELHPGGFDATNVYGVQVTMLGEYASADFDLQNGTFSLLSKAYMDLSTSVATDGLSAQVTAYVLPSSGATNRSVQMMIGSNRFIWNIPDTTQWQAGATYVYRITLGRTLDD